MSNYVKLEPGDPAYLVDFPQMCICGSQKGPMIATGRAPLGSEGQIYLCRLCVTQSARAFGLVKGDEMVRLQNAADELAQATVEVSTRQEIIDRQAVSLGENETKIRQQAGFIENLQGEMRLIRAQAAQVSATAREMAAV